MSTIDKLTEAERKLLWFIRNKSVAQYAMSELTEVRKLIREVKENIETVLPQVVDVLDGKAKIVPI